MASLRDQALRELTKSRPGAPSGPAVVALVEVLAPVIHARVVRVLLHHQAHRPATDLRQEVEDQVQATFAKLFADGGRVLRAWEPDGGLSLLNWVGRFTQLRALDAVRGGLRGPWLHDATEPDFFAERVRASATPEDLGSTRELWLETRRRVLAEESETGRQMFELLFDQDLSTQEIRDRTEKSDAAIFQWRSRLRRSIEQQMRRLVSEVRHVDE